jgi:hypothetical protein
MIVAVIFYVALGVGSFSGCRFISFESTSFPSRTQQSLPRYLDSKHQSSGEGKHGLLIRQQ